MGRSIRERNQERIARVREELLDEQKQAQVARKAKSRTTKKTSVGQLSPQILQYVDPLARSSHTGVMSYLVYCCNVRNPTLGQWLDSSVDAPAEYRPTLEEAKELQWYWRSCVGYRYVDIYELEEPDLVEGVLCATIARRVG